MQPKFYGARPPSIRKNQTRSSPSNQRVNPCSDITVYPAWNLSREAARTSAAMAPSFPDSDCDTSFESCCSSTIALSSNGHHLYASDTSSNLSCSSSGTDTSGSSTRRSSWERSVSVGSCGSKPHKAHDAAWTAIRGLRLREGNVGISHFKLLRKAGQGDIGCVYLSQLRGTPCIFAMKVMDKDALGYRNKVHRMHTEREILGFVDHPFLPTLYAHFETEQFSCLVMEFCPGGDLHALRQRQPGKRFSLKAARFYAAEVLVALEYLHMMGVVYRDLKPENVLVRDDGHIMLSDFDLSLKCEVQPMLLRLPTRQSSRRRRPSIASDASHNPASCTLPSCVSPCTIHPMISCLPVGHRKRPQPSVIASTTSESAAPVQLPHAPEFSTPELVAEPTQARSMSFVGTHEYLAPEIIAGHGHGSAVDWWTFGIFLYELLIGRTPFKGSNNDFTLMNIIKQPLRFPEDLELEVGEAARSLIHGLLVKDPRKRMASMRGAAEIKKHPFFRGVNWALIRCATPPEVPKTHCLDPATKRSYQNVANRVTAPINSLLCEEKRKIWNVNRIVSDSSPDFEYF